MTILEILFKEIKTNPFYLKEILWLLFFISSFKMPRTTPQRLAAKNATAAIKSYYKPKRTKSSRIIPMMMSPSPSLSSLSSSSSSSVLNFSDISSPLWIPMSPISSKKVQKTLDISGRVPYDFDSQNNWDLSDSLIFSLSSDLSVNSNNSSLSTNSFLSTFSYKSKTCRRLFDRNSPQL